MNRKPDHMPMEVWDALQNMPDVELEPVEAYIDSLRTARRVTDKMVDASIAKFAEFGIEFAAPWNGSLDDLEAERYQALRDALQAALDA